MTDWKMRVEGGLLMREWSLWEVEREFKGDELNNVWYEGIGSVREETEKCRRGIEER